MSPLTNEEKAFLLRLARRTLESCVAGKPAELPGEIPPKLQTAAGVFVTLHRGGELRGCVGYILARKPLYRAVMEAATAAALRDPRFSPIRPAELPELEAEISVLSPCQTISPAAIRVGVHGLMVSQGEARGLLLPQVALERQWDRERFLEETCRKACLPADAWRHGAKVEAFTAEVFGEKSLAEKPADCLASTPAPPHFPGKFPSG